MKALVIGPINAEFDAGYNHSVARALEELGVRCELLGFYVSTPPGLMNRLRIDGGLLLGIDTHYRRYVADFNRRAVEAYDRLQPDLVFVIRGSKLSAASLSHMQASVRVLWCQDVVRRCELAFEQLCEYDYRYVFEATDVQWLFNTYQLDAKFLPMAYDPTVYHELAGVSKDIDLSFVGTYYPERRDTLERLARDFPNANLKFFGRHVRYREPSSWWRYVEYRLNGNNSRMINESLGAAEINYIYNRSKTCLNMHHSQSQNGCNPRVFEIMGSGTLQLIDNIPFVDRELRGMVIPYGDYNSLRKSVEASLHSDCTAIARRGAAYAVANHTFTHRMKIVLADIENAGSHSRYSAVLEA